MAFNSLSDLVRNYENPVGDPTLRNYAYDSTHTASGLYQITDSTWRAYAPGAGVSTALYPSAASAPSSVQESVFGNIVAQRGLADWTCPGCNAPLTNYLASNPSAANLPVFGAQTGAGQGAAPGSLASPTQGPGTGYGFDPTTGAYSIPTPATAASNASGATQATATSSTGGWIEQIKAWLSDHATRFGLLILAVIFVLGAMYLFALQSGVSISSRAE